MRQLLILGFALVAASCQVTAPIPSGAPQSQARSPDSIGLPVPTKDEVALVDGQALSIGAFIAIRNQVQGKSSEAAFWVGVAALSLQNSRHAAGQELTPVAAVEVARYALGELPAAAAQGSLQAYLGAQAHAPPPEELRQAIDRVVARSVVQRNPQVLAEIH